MGTVRLNMSQKEMNEARRVQIPDNIIGKMSQGYELTEKEKEIVKSKGKVYVLGHTKERGQTLVKPQLRDLPWFEKKGGVLKVPGLTEEEERKIEEELEEQYRGYYDDELEGEILEATDELRDLGIFDQGDVDLFDSNSDLISVLINYLKEKEEEAEE